MVPEGEGAVKNVLKRWAAGGLLVVGVFLVLKSVQESPTFNTRVQSVQESVQEESAQGSADLFAQPYDLLPDVGDFSPHGPNEFGLFHEYGGGEFEEEPFSYEEEEDEEWDDDEEEDHDDERGKHRRGHRDEYEREERVQD